MPLSPDNLLAIFSANTPARVLESSFQPSNSRPTLVLYSIQLSVTSILLGGAIRTVSLLSDASDPPTTPRASISNSLSDVVATNTQTSELMYLVPREHFVKISVTNSSGTGSVSMVNQTEIIL